MGINLLSFTYNSEHLVPAAGLILLGLILLHLYTNTKQHKLVEKSKKYIAMGIDFFNDDERYLAVKDKNLRYFLVNKAMAGIYEDIEVGFHGKTDEDIFQPELAAKLKALDLNVLRSGKPHQEDISWREKTYRIRKFPLILPDGTEGIGTNGIDITDAVNRRKERERIIRRNEILIDVFTRDFSSSHDQLDYVLKKALALTESTYGYIYLYSETEEAFTLENFARNGKIVSHSRIRKQIYRLDKMGLWSEAVHYRKPMIYHEPKKTTYDLNASGKENVTYFNMMTVPVIIEEKVLAVVGVANNMSGYTNTDAEELSLLMTGVWHAKERKETVTALERTNRSLAENKDKLTHILNSSADGIYGMDVEGNFTFINKSGLQILGYDEASSLIGKNCHQLIHHSNRDLERIPKEKCKIFYAISRGDVVTEENEVFFRKDGSYFPVRYSAHPQILNGEIIGSVVTFTDITMRKIHEENVLYLSYHDALTGLYNRAYLEKVYAELEQEVNLPLSVVVGDVNGLKLSNDIFGHKKGDDFLQRIALIIKGSTREEDLLFRVGGDEFYLFLKNTREDEAKIIMNRISEAISSENFNGVKGSIALGVSVMENMNMSLENTMNDAEQKMYREKTLKRKEESSRQLESFISIMMKRKEDRLHAEKTREIALSIGKALSLPEEDMIILRDAAYLHDIGKIPQIMQKEGRSGFMPTRKDHAIIGYRILNSFEETMDIARVILSHHEKWDGSGYPKGLKEQEIPRLSRIVTVAERFDRLTSEDPDSPEKISEALMDMKKDAGVTLDRELVEVLAEIFEDKKRVG
ncbi:diguanylate cyclase [Proteiniclasticum sp.]|uniref:diguanylate cyclase n=1 Tax=Proteiniclasticum sp. TaxID=2053595 RepID=UPI00289AA30B|nr:diguanylate cyclase [Proteiniclasticum sp.]